MSEEPIKPNPSPEQFAALQEELQKLKANNAKLLDQNIKAKEAGKAIPTDVDVNALIAFKQKKEQEELEAKGRYDEAIQKQAQQFREAEAAYKEKISKFESRQRELEIEAPAITALADADVDVSECDMSFITGVVYFQIPKGVTIYGKFTSIAITTGKVIGYKK